MWTETIEISQMFTIKVNSSVKKAKIKNSFFYFLGRTGFWQSWQNKKFKLNLEFLTQQGGREQK